MSRQQRSPVKRVRPTKQADATPPSRSRTPAAAAAQPPADVSISRRLTAGELNYARTIFGVSIDYRRVLIHNDRAYFFQPEDTAIAPNGEVYYGRKNFKPDFSTDIGLMSWLIHEMVHVYQHQRGVMVRTKGAIFRKYEYGDLTDTKYDFADFYIEQQASIVADYFLIMHGKRPQRGKGGRADYERVIPFLPKRAPAKMPAPKGPKK